MNGSAAAHGRWVPVSESCAIEIAVVQKTVVPRASFRKTTTFRMCCIAALFEPTETFCHSKLVAQFGPVFEQGKGFTWQFTFSVQFTSITSDSSGADSTPAAGDQGDGRTVCQSANALSPIPRTHLLPKWGAGGSRTGQCPDCSCKPSTANSCSVNSQLSAEC